MVAQGDGAICDVTSIYGLAGRPRERRPASRVRNQQAPRGGPDQAGGAPTTPLRAYIQVNAVCPGHVWTPMTE